MRFIILKVFCVLTLLIVSEIYASDGAMFSRESASFGADAADFGDDQSFKGKAADFGGKVASFEDAAVFDSPVKATASDGVLQSEQYIPPMIFPERAIREEREHPFLFLISAAGLLFCGVMLLYKRPNKAD